MEQIEKSAEKVLTLDDVRDSKIYVRNNVSYMPPKTLVDPFLEAISFDAENHEVRIEVQNPVVNQEIAGEENIAYPRFLIEVKKSDHLFEDVRYQNVFGMLVAMDQQKGIVKTYNGMNVEACLNLCVFDAADCHSQDLNSDLSKLFEITNGYSVDNEGKIETYRTIHRKLVGTVLKKDETDEAIGHALRMARRTKLGTTPVVQASALLDDKRSIYYTDKETTLYNVYNAITQGITNSKDLLYAPEKTIAVGQILNIMN